MRFFDSPITAKARIESSEQALQRTLPDARLQVTPLPTVEQVKLALINADYQTGPLPADVMQAVIARPAYWAFCWGSGLGLARWLLQNPDVVAGKRVADVGCGCGIGAIAAKMAGANEVIACDKDQDALLSARTNAELNNVSLAFANDVAYLDNGFDLILMADVLYDRSNYPLLQIAKSLTQNIIVADSRIQTIDDTDFAIFPSASKQT